MLGLAIGRVLKFISTPSVVSQTRHVLQKGNLFSSLKSFSNSSHHPA